MASESLGEVFVEILGNTTPFADDFAETIGDAGTMAQQELSSSLGEATDDMAADFTEAGSEAAEGLTGPIGDAAGAVSEDLAAAGSEGGEGLAAGVTQATEGVAGELGAVGEEAGAALVGNAEDAVAGMDLDATAAFAPIGEAAQAAGAETVDTLSAAGGDAAAALAGAVADVDMTIDTSGFETLSGEATATAEEVSASFEGVGEEIGGQVETGLETAGGALENFREKVGSLQGALATMAGGAGLEAFARGQSDTNATLARAAIVTGEEEDALRGAAVEMANHTFAAGDAVAGMDRLIKGGVNTRKEFERILPAVDTFADATGGDLVASVDSFDRILSALDEPMTNVEDHLDTMTFLTTQTTVRQLELGQLMRREAPALRNMELSVDDVAVAMASLEAEGRRGPRAVMGFQEAIKGAEGDVGKFWQELGVSNETLEEQQANLADAAGLTDKLAEANTAVMTPMERLTANVGNLMVRFGGLAEAAGMVAAPLGAIGPSMLALNQTQQFLSAGLGAKLAPALKAAGGAFKALALTIWANPLFLIGAVILGVIAIIWIFRDDIMAALGGVFSWLGDRLSGVIGWFRDLPGNILDAIQGFVTVVVPWLMQHHPVAYLFRFVTGTIPRVLGAVAGLVGDVLGWFASLRDLAVAYVAALVGRVVGWFAGLVARAVARAAALRDQVIGAVAAMRHKAVELVGRLVAYVVGFPARIVRGLGNIGRTLYGLGKDLIQGLIDGATSLLSRIGEFFLDKVPGFIKGPLKKALGIGSPSTVFAEFGGDLMDGLAEGVAAQSAAALDEIERFANQAGAAATIEPVVEPVEPVDTRPRGPASPGVVDPGGAAAGPQVNQYISTTDPVKAARESVRQLRDRAYLSAPFDADHPVGEGR